MANGSRNMLITMMIMALVEKPSSPRAAEMVQKHN